MACFDRRPSSWCCTSGSAPSIARTRRSTCTQLIEAGDTRWSHRRRQPAARHGRRRWPRLRAQGGALHAGDGVARGRVPLRAHRVDPRGAARTSPTLAAADRRAAPMPRTRIISFTVTEAGYYLDATGPARPALRRPRDDLDARRGDAGSTIYGAIAAILRARACGAAAAPVTLLNCDNLRHNGERFRAGLLDFLERARRDRAAATGCERNTTLPERHGRPHHAAPAARAARARAAATGWDDARAGDGRDASSSG